MKKIFALLIPLMLLGACSTTKYVAKPELYEKPELAMPAVPPVSLKTYDLTVDSADKFCVSPDSYEAIENNSKAMRDYVSKLKVLLQSYKDYYKPDATPIPQKTPKP